MKFWTISFLCLSIIIGGGLRGEEVLLPLITPEEEEGVIEPYPKKPVGKSSKDGVNEAGRVSQYVLPIVAGVFFVGALIVVAHNQGHHHHHHAHNQ